MSIVQWVRLTRFTSFLKNRSNYPLSYTDNESLLMIQNLISGYDLAKILKYFPNYLFTRLIIKVRLYISINRESYLSQIHYE